jgi:hypothetical protein
MNINKPVILTPHIESRFQNFIVFDPSSSRINEQDILFQGYEVQEIFDKLQDKLSSKSDIKTQIIQNKMAKIGQMLELLANYDNIIISKFFDRVWRRYAYISNLGENFLEIKTFLECFPEYKEDKMAIIAKRIDLTTLDDFQASDNDKSDKSDKADDSDASDTQDAKVISANPKISKKDALESNEEKKPIATGQE